MKKIVFLFCIFFSAFLVAQEPPKMQKYVAKNAAGLFYYQEEEIPKKVKIKKEATKNATQKLVRKYNDKIRTLTFLNNQKLSELELLVNSLGSQLRTNRELGQRVRKKIEEVILPIRDSIVKNEKELNQGLEDILSKKQFKKWLKYQRNEKKKLLPKRPKSSNPNPQRNMNRGRRNGNRRF